MKRLVLCLLATFVLGAFAVPATESVAFARPGVCAPQKSARKHKAKKKPRHAKKPRRGKKGQAKGTTEDVGSARPKGSKGLQL
jgi:Ni/Co efflux regulator RcnB